MIERFEFAPGAFIKEIPGEKFKRSKIIISLVTRGKRENATKLALLPHLLERRSADIPDAITLSRTLYRLYGAELSGESYTAGANRVVSLGISGLKSEFALNGEDLAGEYLRILCGLLFNPVTENGAFAAEDLAIEKEKQADFLKSEMNDKRGYCLRQARRKLYGDSPLGIESPGYLEDLDACTPQSVYQSWQKLLETAQVEVLVCGIDAKKAAEHIGGYLQKISRAPVAPAKSDPIEKTTEFAHYKEPMQTVQGKLCILLTNGKNGTAEGDAVMRVASAVYGALPTSRLFVNVREKQSLCYYCSTSHGFYGGTLMVDSGVDHAMAQKAGDAIMHELDVLQKQPASEEELNAAKMYLESVFSSAKDSPDALMSFAFNEWLRGTNRTLDETIKQIWQVTPQQVQAALAEFAPSVEYIITEAEENA